jgi:hypothetical protein
VDMIFDTAHDNRLAIEIGEDAAEVAVKFVS